MKSEDTRLVRIFDENASRLGSRLAVREREKDWNYQELLARSRDFSDYLVSLGVQDGHRIAVVLPNSGVFVTALFGILRTGAVIVPLNDRYRKQELQSYLDDVSLSAVVVPREAVGQVSQSMSGKKHPPLLIEASVDGKFRMLEGGEVKDVQKGYGGDLPALLQYTSGSTGEPKRVLRTQSQLVFELERLSRIFDLGERDRYLGAAPFSHVNGLVRTMMASMFSGGTLYPLRNFNRREVLRIISEERITYFGGVPYMYITLTATPLRGTVDLSSIRTAFSSSAPLLADDNRAFESKFGFYIRQLYGSTETGTISVNTDRDIRASLQSVGRPLEGVRVEIFNDRGTMLPEGQEGEVGISSPAAIKGYEDNHTANALSFKGDFYLSGDLGFKDGKGRLTLTGRKKFLINRGGYEVNPFETERVIMGYSKVEEAAVFGVPTRHGDQTIKCLVVAREACSEKEIIEHCRSNIADYKIPAIIEFVKTLPKSRTGKILREKCIREDRKR